MRILHLVSYSLFSGPMPAALGLAMAQRALGHQVYLAFDQIRGNFDGYEEAAAQHVEAAGIEPPGSTLHLSTKAGWVRTLADIWNLHRLIRAAHIEVVHSHTAHDHTLMTLPPLRRQPLFRTAHNAHLWQRRPLQGRLLARCAGLVVRSPAHRALLNLHFGVPQVRLCTIAASIDAARFVCVDVAQAQQLRATWRQKLAIPLSVPLLGHVALMARRGQETLLHAMQQVPKLHALFVGDGARRQALQQQAQRLGLAQRVHFAGYIPSAQLPQVYQALDAAYVAQPGKDAGARAALEAMASAVPLLAVQTGALTQLCDETRGIPVLTAGPACLAAALHRWLAQPQQARRRARVAQRYVQTQRHFLREAELTCAFYRARLASGQLLPTAS